MGVPMELPEARQTSQSGCEDVPVATCAQGRLINDLLTNRGSERARVAVWNAAGSWMIPPRTERHRGGLLGTFSTGDLVKAHV